MSELKISKERVIEATKKCPDAKRILETLFPEIIDTGFDFSHLASVGGQYLWTHEACQKAGLEFSAMQVCTIASPKYNDKAFYLSSDYDWRLEKAEGAPGMILIPTRK